MHAITSFRSHQEAQFKIKFHEFYMKKINKLNSSEMFCSVNPHHRISWLYHAQARFVIVRNYCLTVTFTVFQQAETNPQTYPTYTSTICYTLHSKNGLTVRFHFIQKSFYMIRESITGTFSYAWNGGKENGENIIANSKLPARVQQMAYFLKLAYRTYY